MKMPNCKESVVYKKKITDYLLSKTHVIGKCKEKFFSAFGFNVDDTKRFENALIKHSIEREVQNLQHTGFGLKYTLTCEVETPDGRNPCIVTVWIIKKGEKQPILVTAFPH